MSISKVFTTNPACTPQIYASHRLLRIQLSWPSIAPSGRWCSSIRTNSLVISSAERTTSVAAERKSTLPESCLTADGHKAVRGNDVVVSPDQLRVRWTRRPRTNIILPHNHSLVTPYKKSIGKCILDSGDTHQFGRCGKSQWIRCSPARGTCQRRLDRQALDVATYGRHTFSSATEEGNSSEPKPP
jgi:hypothetical protein